MAAFAVLLTAADALVAGHQDDRFPPGRTRPATVLAVAEGTNPTVDLWYTAPDGTRRDATAHVRHLAFVPRPGDAVVVRVASDDDQVVLLDEDARSWHEELPLYLAGLALAVAFWAVRRWHIGRTEQMAGRPGTAFAMRAAVVPPDLLRRRWRLALYALDAAPAAEPVCEVALLTVPSVPSGVFSVEVKGAPRPFGRIAVRAGDEMLWPRGRALPRAATPRPAALGELFPPLPPRRPVPPGRDPSPWPARAVVVGLLAFLALTLWSLTASDEQRGDLLARSRPARGTVTAPVAPNGAVDITFTDRGTTRHATLVRSATPGLQPGAEVAVRYDPTDPSVVFEQGDDVPPGSGSMLFFLFLAMLPGALYGIAALRGRAAAQIGARELVTAGRVERGTPPARSTGLSWWDGSLELRRPALPLAARRANPTVLRLTPDALIVADGSGRATVCEWDLGCPRPTSAPGAGRWSVHDGGSSGRGSREVVLSLAAPEPAGTARDVRTVVNPPDDASTIIALLHHLVVASGARSALDDAGRVITLVALLTCGAGAGAFVVLDAPAGPDPVSG